MYLNTVSKPMKNGSYISGKLDIDYIYVMKLMRSMFAKEWIKTYRYDETTYFEITEKAPLDKAKVILSDEQRKLSNQYQGLR